MMCSLPLALSASKMLKQILIGGTSGQGSVHAGKHLAKAAAYEGYHVAQSARFGAAVRNGSSVAHILISDKSIDYPYVESPDILVALSQEIYDCYTSNGGMPSHIYYDSTLVTPNDRLDAGQTGIPATQFVLNEFRTTKGANMILLGVLAAQTNIVPLKSLEKHLSRSHPHYRVNRLALNQASALLDTAIDENRSSQKRNQPIVHYLERCQMPLKNGQAQHTNDSSERLCHLCEMICPDFAISRNPNTGTVLVNPDRCKRCGLCVEFCPREALEI